MSQLVRSTTAVFLCVAMTAFQFTLEGCGSRVAPSGKPSASITAHDSAQPSTPLRGYLQRSYMELFALAPTLELSSADVESQRHAFADGEKMCVSRFKEHSKQYQTEIRAAQNELKKKNATITDEQRTGLHCKIQNLELLDSEAKVLANTAIPTAYDNLNAKLELIEKWPAIYQQTKLQVAHGTAAQRRWGDVKDIGFRSIADGQEDDIKRGQDSIEELKRAGMMPKDVEDKAILDYVNSVAQKIAKASDLKVPLHITVLQSREVNAFALPGGYLFIERGLLEAAEDESELAGVIAHEISHDVARHSNKLMKRATIASIFYQAAQVAAMILTGGAAGVGLYYALQYGFYGLGLVIDLKLLGVSRAYELEADQLGIQYAWNAGYDPSGFIRFFDKMATKEGYVNGVSWFRTHPPFYQRMVESQREILFLEAKPATIVQTSAFERMKKALAPISVAQAKEEADRPSLKLGREEGCQPPPKLEYTSEQPIEELCALPARSASLWNPKSASSSGPPARTIFPRR